MEVIGHATFEEVNFILKNGRDLIVSFSIECSGDFTSENERYGTENFSGNPYSENIDWEEPIITSAEVIDEDSNIANLNKDENDELEIKMISYAQSRTCDYEVEF